MRRAFIKAVTRLAEEREDVYLLTGDAGFTILEDFRARFPDRYYNIGIAEAAMVGTAAGLALAGKQVFVYTIAPFATMRCFEQVRVDLCYQKLPVKLVGVGQGVTYGSAGATHHAIEDIGVMRVLPGMTVICPGDPREMAETVRRSISLEGPCYIRLGKSGEPVIHQKEGIDFSIGRGIVLERGERVALIATGNMLPEAVKTAAALKKKGFQPEVISMHTVKPIDAELIEETAGRCALIATLEEHNLIGGLGDAVGGVILEKNLPARLVKFGIPDAYAATAGCQDYLRECFGLGVGQMTEKLLGVLSED